MTNFISLNITYGHRINNICMCHILCMVENSLMHLRSTKAYQSAHLLWILSELQSNLSVIYKVNPFRTGEKVHYIRMFNASRFINNRVSRRTLFGVGFLYQGAHCIRPEGSLYSREIHLCMEAETKADRFSKTV